MHTFYFIYTKYDFFVRLINKACSEKWLTDAADENIPSQIYAIPVNKTLQDKTLFK